MKDWKTNGAVIVSWDLSHGKDKEVLLVCKQTKGKVEVINAFQGEEALDIYKKLLPKEEPRELKLERRDTGEGWAVDVNA